MFIDSNQKRVNIHAKLKTPAFDSMGFQHDYPDTEEIRAQLGITEIPDPARGNDETQYTTEIDEAPYVVITDKPEWMVAEVKNAKVQSQIDALERDALMPRGTREVIKTLMETQAAAQNITAEQLYLANIGYKKLVDLHTAIADLRTQFVPVVGKPE